MGLNKESYTYDKRPLKLIFNQEFIQFEQAKDFEKKIKKCGRAKKLALANENFERIKDLSVCKNDTNSDNYKNK